MEVLSRFVLLWRLKCFRKTLFFLAVLCLLQANVVSEAIFFLITEPEKLHYLYQINPSYQIGARFPPYTMSNLGLVYADPADGCEPLDNANIVNGEVVLMERGQCTFAEKVINAELAGAVMAIITDSSSNSDDFVEMVPDETGRRGYIPSAYLPGPSGRRIRHYLLYEHPIAYIDIPLNYTVKPIDPGYHRPPWETCDRHNGINKLVSHWQVC